MTTATIPNGRTLNEIAIDVAKDLPQPFSVEQLTVACFQAAPRRFCLEGFPELPNNNTVVALLSGRNGPVKTGYFVRTSPGHYAVVARKGAAS